MSVESGTGSALSSLQASSNRHNVGQELAVADSLRSPIESMARPSS